MEDINRELVHYRAQNQLINNHPIRSGTNHETTESADFILTNNQGQTMANKAERNEGLEL